MNAPLLPEVLLGTAADAQPELPLAAEGVQRYVWHGAFGAMLIEVHDGAAWVNGRRVEPLAETLTDPADQRSVPPGGNRLPGPSR